MILRQGRFIHLTPVKLLTDFMPYDCYKSESESNLTNLDSPAASFRNKPSYDILAFGGPSDQRSTLAFEKQRQRVEAIYSQSSGSELR
jgi:hypothetical protein